MIVAGAVDWVVDEEELVLWGAELGRVAASSDTFVALYGALGSGKSTLVRSACRAAGVEGPVPSPTFTLVNRHALPDGRYVHHVDLYRIESADQVWELGWEELVSGPGPVFVEWAERAAALLPRDRWDVRLGFVDEPLLRRVQACPYGDAPELPARAPRTLA
ncbi:MAG: tRNA (adenosine(37)-N6)-threonylcarbamoyltransferase complex ATPase subunit type 1 TsaE [Gemmatimonadetes bacterium]|nr:tRNA (adenosine(37)-N6)-threonylcarbamoyltransferase complex ATPase subunit type 1 TsaE [Gemmatimonadota bacterium]